MDAPILHEVGLRDGLQMESRTVPTAVKLAWTGALVRAGVDIIQAGSFVHPTKVPQMADADLLFRELASCAGGGGAVFSALVLNEKGMERALGAGAGMLCMGVSASETHSRKNTGMGVEEATGRIIAMAREARAAGTRVQVSVQSAFGCGYEGHVPPERVLAIAARFLEADLGALSLADTAGHATPAGVEEMFASLRRLDERAELACHFHNTYGLALANCWAAMRAGVRCVETSIAGLGGCPFTKIAGGNACTEDFVHMLQRMGLRCEVDLGALITLAREIETYFGRELPGTVYRTGPIPAGTHTPGQEMA